VRFFAAREKKGRVFFVAGLGKRGRAHKKKKKGREGKNREKKERINRMNLEAGQSPNGIGTLGEGGL